MFEAYNHALAFHVLHSRNFCESVEKNLSCNHSCHIEIRGTLLQEHALKLRSKYVFEWTTGLCHCLRMAVSKEQPWGWRQEAEWRKYRWVYLTLIQLNPSLAWASSKILLIILIPAFAFYFLKEDLPNCISFRPYRI